MEHIAPLYHVEIDGYEIKKIQIIILSVNELGTELIILNYISSLSETSFHKNYFFSKRYAILYRN